MTVLLPFFSDIETNAADLDVATVERRQKIYDNIRSYNRLFSGINVMIYDSELNPSSPIPVKRGERAESVVQPNGFGWL